jgi:hypothetical protein
MTASLVATNAYALRDGKLVPGAREAVAQVAHFVPRKFLEGVAREAAASVENPAMRVQKFYAGMGTSFDYVLSGDLARANGMAPAPIATDVEAEIAKQEHAGERARSIAMAGLL